MPMIETEQFLDVSNLSKKQVQKIKATNMKILLDSYFLQETNSDLQRSRGVVRFTDTYMSNNFRKVDYVISKDGELWKNMYVKSSKTGSFVQKSCTRYHIFKDGTPLHKKLKKLLQVALYYRAAGKRKEYWSKLHNWYDIMPPSKLKRRLKTHFSTPTWEIPQW